MTIKPIEHLRSAYGHRLLKTLLQRGPARTGFRFLVPDDVWRAGRVVRNRHHAIRVALDFKRKRVLEDSATVREGLT
jgi:hypothetical protein